MYDHGLDEKNVAYTNENGNCQEPEISETQKKAETQKEAEKQIAELEEKVLGLQNELALARADFYNYRQRNEKEKTKMRASISEDRILEFIPVLDNLDRALNVSKNSTVSDVLKGVKMVQKQFLNVLQELGVEVITINTNEDMQKFEFDPLQHDAVGTEEVTDPSLDGKIVEELLKGYRTKERVLRPSQVRVGKLSAKE